MNKNVLSALVVLLVVLIGGFFLFNHYVYTEKQASGNEALAVYFSEEIFERATSDGMIPIEGYDAGLLLAEFPSLVVEDFDGVETFEGVYHIENGELVFNRQFEQPVSSAERTISQDGYSMLLTNVSERLNMPIQTQEEINTVIDVLEKATFQKKTDEEVAIAFSYRTNPNGYRLEELEFDAAPSLPDPGFVKGWNLILEQDYQELQESDVPREGPPTINVIVFKNPQQQSPQVWVQEHASFSNIGIINGELEEFTLNGQEAVRYMYDGLYMNDTIVVTYGEYVYMISGAYVNPQQTIRQDFHPFIDSIEFLSE
ncbi:MAG: hypothetical protein ACJKTH_01945 [Patescibacteria group bacterium UBA2163]